MNEERRLFKKDGLKGSMLIYFLIIGMEQFYCYPYKKKKGVGNEEYISF